jgi:hypothetical protein
VSHMSVQTKLDSSFKLHYYHVQKQVQLLSFLSMNKRLVSLYFLNKGSTAILLFSSALLISLNFPFICVLSFFIFCCLLGLPFASVIRVMSPQLTWSTEGLL